MIDELYRFLIVFDACVGWFSNLTERSWWANFSYRFIFKLDENLFDKFAFFIRSSDQKGLFFCGQKATTWWNWKKCVRKMFVCWFVFLMNRLTQEEFQLEKERENRKHKQLYKDEIERFFHSINYSTLFSCWVSFCFSSFVVESIWRFSSTTTFDEERLTNMYSCPFEWTSLETGLSFVCAWCSWRETAVSNSLSSFSSWSESLSSSSLPILRRKKNSKRTSTFLFDLQHQRSTFAFSKFDLIFDAVFEIVARHFICSIMRRRNFVLKRRKNLVRNRQTLRNVVLVIQIGLDSRNFSSIVYLDPKFSHRHVELIFLDRFKVRKFR